MKHYILASSVLALSLYLITSATTTHAVSATPSATVTEAIDEQTIKDNLETRIKNIVKENLSTTEAKLQEKIVQQSLFGTTGVITEITSTHISLKTSSDIFQIKTTDKTIFVKNNQNIKLSNLAISDKIILIGTTTNKPTIIDAKRIVVIKDETRETPSVYYGKILSTEANKKIVSLSYNGNRKDFVLSKRANLKITDFTIGKSAVIITNSQDVGLVISLAKVY